MSSDRLLRVVVPVQLERKILFKDNIVQYDITRH